MLEVALTADTNTSSKTLSSSSSTMVTTLSSSKKILFSMVLNPMKETFKVKVPLFNLNEKFPSKSDEIPWFVS